MHTDDLKPNPLNKEQDDPVNHPKHYNMGKIEVADFIADQKLDYDEGNVVKYVCRWKHKGGIQDLKKAMWYLQHKLDMVSADQLSEVKK